MSTKHDYFFFLWRMENARVLSDEWWEGKRGRKYIITLIVSVWYRFDISNRFRSDRREFASDCDTYATRYEIRKKRGKYASERRRRHQTSLTGSRVIQKTPAGLSLPTSPHRHHLRSDQIFPLFIRSQESAVTSRLISYWFLAARY